LADAKLVYLPGGSFDLPVWTGLERETLKLNASGRLSIDQIAHSLLVKQKIGHGTAYRTYLLSLIAPATPVSAVKLNKDEFFYAARSVIYTHSRLVLHDIYNRTQTYELVAGRQDEEKLVGRRTHAEEADPRLDVDLFHSASRPEAPEAFKSISRQQMRIFYKVTENMWWAQLEERTTVPVYVNNLRLTSGTPIQLISGDVLTFGPSVEQYYARLEVEVFTRLE
jgi:hypothetical protein